MLPSFDLDVALEYLKLLRMPWLYARVGERLVLKGGTAVNLFYLELARLSVDIDLNYIGQLDREEMQRERPEIVKATEQIAEALGYKVQKSADDYALNEWFLAYQTTSEAPTRFRLRSTF